MAFEGSCGDTTRSSSIVSSIVLQPSSKAGTRGPAQGSSARIVLESFSLAAIDGLGTTTSEAAAAHVAAVLEWFGVPITPVTGIREPVVRTETRLYQNEPNPFNPSTVIPFALHERARVRIRIYDVSGRLVRTLLDEVRDPGVYRDVRWDGRTDDGRSASSGVYFVRLQAGRIDQVRKMVLLK
jgi:hypothetical protein